MLSPAVNQVAGHEAGAGGLGPLVDNGGRFYKPLQDGERGETEIKFYQQLWADQNVPHGIKAYFPQFYGTIHIASSDGSEPCEHAILEDLTHNFHHPIIMDVKMGFRTWYEGASENYIAKCMKKDKETTSGALGFRISGMQVFEAASGRIWKPDRNWLRLLTSDDIKSVLKRFVSSNPEDSTNLDTVFASSVYGGPHGLIEQLLYLKTWFETQTYYHFHSSSLLFIYELDTLACDVGGRVGASPPQGRAVVKLIDFAHTLTGQDILDENFLKGLVSLIDFLNQIVDASIVGNHGG